MSGSRTTTKDDGLLDNVHPGSIMREDFLIGREIPVDEVASATGIARETLDAILVERAPIDAATDLRLARYFGISEGFFLGLQIDFDLEEERRAHGDELSRIRRRAA
jgi:antitoxin HigA-1